MRMKGGLDLLYIKTFEGLVIKIWPYYRICSTLLIASNRKLVQTSLSSNENVSVLYK